MKRLAAWFTPTLAAAGIDLTHAPSYGGGQGGGGQVQVTPFGVDSLMLGPVLRRQTYAYFGPFPPALEMGQGFRIAGLLSHGFLRFYRLTIDFDRMRHLLH